ncbi:hypothetical protein M8818_000054 [Zalaria obscura]|uniref:Uncharacterized protein n=1 Tax=Zalaria obscura TaxID=2024903 RepID=A0ACC3SP47_9PEZI
MSGGLGTDSWTSLEYHEEYHEEYHYIHALVQSGWVDAARGTSEASGHGGLPKVSTTGGHNERLLFGSLTAHLSKRM